MIRQIFLETFFKELSLTLQALNQDILMGTKEEEWGNVLCLRDSVVLRDRLMTDAALGGPRPIKSEHSYSLLASSPPPSPAKPGASPYTPNSGSSSDAVGSSTASTSSSVDFTNLDHKPLDIRGRIDGKIIHRLCYTLLESVSSEYKSVSDGCVCFHSESTLFQIWRKSIFRLSQLMPPRIAADRRRSRRPLPRP